MRAQRSAAWENLGIDMARTQALLTCLELLAVDGSASFSHERWARLVEDEFSKIWKCGDPHLWTLQKDWLRNCGSAELRVCDAEVRDALALLRHSVDLDCSGICVAAVRTLRSACPS